MAQYIDKSALVAEIEKRLNYRVESIKAINDGTFWKEEQGQDEFNKPLTRCAFNTAKNELFELKCFIDTLEAKEVDLEKELIEWHKEHFKKDGTFLGMSGFYLTNNSQMDIAIHFYELGLKAQKGER